MKTKGIKFIILVLIIITAYFSFIAVRHLGFATSTTHSNFTIIEEVAEEEEEEEGEDIVDFALDREFIKVVLKQGEHKMETVKAYNIGNVTLDFEVNYGELKRFLIIGDNNFSLRPGESKTLNLYFFAAEDEKPDVFTGRIIVRGEDYKQRGVVGIINVVVEVKEKVPLIDVFVDVFEEEVIQGQEVNASINILNKGDLRGFDIRLHYSVKDFAGEEIVFKEESVKIDEELNLSKSLKLPDDAYPGRHIFYASVAYKNITASGSDSFEVVSEEKPFAGIIRTEYLWMLLLLILLIIYFIIWMREKKEERVKKK